MGSSNPIDRVPDTSTGFGVPIDVANAGANSGIRHVASHFQGLSIAHCAWHTNCFFCALVTLRADIARGARPWNRPGQPMQPKESDEVLVSAAKGGDRQAFEE